GRRPGDRDGPPRQGQGAPGRALRPGARADLGGGGPGRRGGAHVQGDGGRRPSTGRMPRHHERDAPAAGLGGAGRPAVDLRSPGRGARRPGPGAAAAGGARPRRGADHRRDAGGGRAALGRGCPHIDRLRRRRSPAERRARAVAARRGLPPPWLRQRRGRLLPRARGSHRARGDLPLAGGGPRGTWRLRADGPRGGPGRGVIRAIVSDFGGVLTTPMIEGFLAYQDQTGVTVAELGRAMAEAQKRYGEHPLFQLERGEISEPEFGKRLADALPDPFDLRHLREVYFEQLQPNAEMIDYMRDLRGRGLRMALCTNNVREWEPLWRSKLPELDEIFE